MSPAVRFVNCCRRFGSVRAVDGVTLDIAQGEFFAMLGPSGSGKTTCLRLIAGFEQPDEGHIEIFGETAEGVPPYKRNVNTVFQDYALFPHMTVGENVAYGLRIKGVPRAERETKAKKALAMVKLAGYEDRRPAQLSGGQRQRVALARALVNGPKVLLLDEPLGALDLKLREQMQEELKALQKELGITFVFVTHDQGEALSMADRVAVFNEGKIVQVGVPDDVYERPRSRFVADFVGSSNVLSPEFASRHGGAAKWTSLRPEKIGVFPAGKKVRRPAGTCRWRDQDDQLSGRGHALQRGDRTHAAFRRNASRRTKPQRRRQRAPDLAKIGDGHHGGGRVSHVATVERESGISDKISDIFFARPKLLTLLLLLPPLLWIGIVYVGSLFALLLQSFYSLDDFSGLIVREFTLSTYAQLLEEANIQIIIRTVSMAALVTLACAVIAFPIAYYAARYARGWTKALFYLAVMMPLWSSYLVKVYAWKLILAKEGILTWLAKGLHLSWLIDGILALPVIGGPSLSFSYIGTFLVFVYIWIPYMILPTQAALERVPINYIEASADLGAEPKQTFWTVIFPLALPGIIAGSIFTFSLTLGDYIVPTIVGNSRLMIGQAVYTLQGTAGNVPLAAAFTVVPMAIMGIYLWVAKRMGAFDVL